MSLHCFPAANDIIARIGRAVLASRCLVCSESGADGQDLCRTCALALPWNRCACGRCGLPLASASEVCGSCLKRPPPFEKTQAAFVYGFPIDHLLPRFKFHADLAAGALLAALMATTLLQVDRPEALVPVPLHRSRLRQRGYDQALELAKSLSRRLQIPLHASLLVREHATSAQSQLGALARRRNVRGAFACRGNSIPVHVALVDDVMTTAATAQECARTLRRAGVARVDIWVLARVSGRQW